MSINAKASGNIPTLKGGARTQIDANVQGKRAQIGRETSQVAVDIELTKSGNQTVTRRKGKDCYVSPHPTTAPAPAPNTAKSQTQETNKHRKPHPTNFFLIPSHTHRHNSTFGFPVRDTRQSSGWARNDNILGLGLRESGDDLDLVGGGGGNDGDGLGGGGVSVVFSRYTVFASVIVFVSVVVWILWGKGAVMVTIPVGTCVKENEVDGGGGGGRRCVLGKGRSVNGLQAKAYSHLRHDESLRKQGSIDSARLPNEAVADAKNPKRKRPKLVKHVVVERTGYVDLNPQYAKRSAIRTGELLCPFGSHLRLEKKDECEFFQL
ncbi:hypothetical protein BDZ91DRAFT_765998 [Kalaharituber pfeilii]|nr:hypothetical protein BDZ91DRAFT_765998 [Kalaharituber pfeilii]